MGRSAGGTWIWRGWSPEPPPVPAAAACLAGRPPPHAALAHTGRRSGQPSGMAERVADGPPCPQPQLGAPLLSPFRTGAGRCSSPLDAAHAAHRAPAALAGHRSWVSAAGAHRWGGMRAAQHARSRPPAPLGHPCGPPWPPPLLTVAPPSSRPRPPSSRPSLRPRACRARGRRRPGPPRRKPQGSARRCRSGRRGHGRMYGRREGGRPSGHGGKVGQGQVRSRGEDTELVD